MTLTPIHLPAVMGNYGDIVFFSSTMPIKDVAARVDFVNDIHDSKKMSEMIQRALDPSRIAEISKYISDDTRDRFFNSLVLAVYDGTPKWYPADIESSEFDTSTCYEGSAVGILSFSGEESIIAIDGQHRLAGIKDAIAHHDPKDIIIPVLFIAHDKKKSSKVRKRNRRLFTMLNKHAKPVDTFEIISLDEDEAPAIVTRMLVEERNIIPEDIIAFDRSGSIKPGSTYWDESLITIEDLYSVTCSLLTKVHPKKKRMKEFSTQPRPSDEVLVSYYDMVIEYFELLGKKYRSIGSILSASTKSERSSILSRHRVSSGGHLLFRPKGFLLYANLISMLKDKSLEERFALCKNVPTQLSDAPYWGTLWKKEGGIREGEEAKARGLLLNVIMPELVSDKRRTQLREAYANIYGLDVSDTKLPTTFEEFQADKKKYNRF